MKSQFLIAAPMSGSGKTTVARGLMALFSRQGLAVQPFKCGPDYIDTKFHAQVCGRPSVNLDTFMATPAHVRELYAHYGRTADVCVVEGMMGLFDGYDRERGSSYEVARTLQLPVVLVVDARSAAYSMAALLQGFLHFRSDASICGIIFNKVGSEKHYRQLRQICNELHVSCLGCLPRRPSLEQSSRYLGLDFSQEAESQELVQLLAEHVSWSELLRLTSRPFPDGCRSDTSPFGDDSMFPAQGSVMVARNDESFSFLYQETLDRLPPPVFFNPECDVPCLDHVGLLYLPGGYPEKHAAALSANAACRKAISRYAGRGGRIVAECGGMMYLCESIIVDTPEGGSTEYPMCGVLPYKITARQADRRLSLGYRRFMLNGREYRGHEFHYSQFLQQPGFPFPSSAVQVYNAQGEPVPTPVFSYKNVLASYTHLYQL